MSKSIRGRIAAQHRLGSVRDEALGSLWLRVNPSERASAHTHARAHIHTHIYTQLTANLNNTRATNVQSHVHKRTCSRAGRKHSFSGFTLKCVAAAEAQQQRLDLPHNTRHTHRLCPLEAPRRIITEEESARVCFTSTLSV